jgi:hypothetical protein
MVLEREIQYCIFQTTDHVGTYSNELRESVFVFYSSEVGVSYDDKINQFLSPSYSFSRNLRSFLHIGGEIQAATFHLGHGIAPKGSRRNRGGDLILRYRFC